MRGPLPPPFLFLLTFLRVFFFLCASSLIPFYLFFESSLFPVLLLIIGWGYQFERMRASNYFLIYTLFCSFPFFSFLLGFLKEESPFLFSPLFPVRKLVRVSFLAFLAKVPLFFRHLWLPKAHVEAPTGGSMVLAAILLKLGGVALFRLKRLLKRKAIKAFLFVGL